MDFRDLAAALGQWWDSVDMRSMRAMWSGESVEVAFAVCPTCDGRGQYVNPGIDSNGLSREDMDELGEEFMEDYFSGGYDIMCATCKGQRVVPVPTDPEVIEELQAMEESRYETAMMYASEKRMGC